MKYSLLSHGTDGYPEENWFPWLKKELENKSYYVDVPQFPTPENQTPEAWFEVLEPYQKQFNSETLLIGHSCGGLFLLRVLEKIPVTVKAAIFVASSAGIPPLTYHERDLPFLRTPFDWSKIRASAKHFLVFHSEDDPFIGIANGEKIATELSTPLIRLNNAGHFNAKAGYTHFELLMKHLKPPL